MNTAARELHEWITGNGYGVLEERAGSGHLRYRLRNGRAYHSSATPSAYTAVPNGKAQIRRLLGLASESPRAGKYRHRPSDGYDGRPAPTGSGWGFPPEVQDLQSRVRECDARLDRLNPARQAKEVRKWTNRRSEAVDQLNRYGVLVPPFKH